MTELTALVYRRPRKPTRPPIDWTTIAMVSGAVLAAIGWAALCGVAP